MKKLSKPIQETSLQLKEVAAPSTPSTGYVELYAKTDGKLYLKDDAGTETDLSSGGGGGSSISLSPVTTVQPSQYLGNDAVPQQTYAHAVIVGQTTKVDRMSVYCFAYSGTPCTLEMGIYDGAGALLASGTVSITSTGLKTVSFTEQTLTNGLYYLAIVNQTNDASTTFPWGNNAGVTATLSRIVGGTTSLAGTLGAGSGTGRTYALTAWSSTASSAISGGSGDVVGAAASTDTAIARFDSTTGKLLQDSTVLITDNGSIVIPENSFPTAADTGTIKLFAREIAGRIMPAFMGPSGLDSTLQPHLGRNKRAEAVPAGNSTTINYMGIALTATGTATTASFALTNVHTAMRRLEYAVTTASTSAVAGWRDSQLKYNVGNAFGGFHYICRFGPSRGVAADSTRRHFNGFTSVTAAPTDVNPSTIANCLGVGADSTDTNYFIMHRTGTGTVVKVDTGIAKSAADTTEMYELNMFTPPGGTYVNFTFNRLNTADTFSYTATSSLPASSTLLAPRGWTSVGGTSSAVGISLVGLYIETDY